MKPRFLLLCTAVALSIVGGCGRGQNAPADKIGVETIRAIVKHFEGEDVPPEILIPTALYRKADAEKDESLKR